MGATRGTRAVGGGLRVRVATRPETHRGARPVSRTPTGPRSVCSCYLHLRHTATHLLLSCSTPMHGYFPRPDFTTLAIPTLNGTRLPKPCAPTPRAPRPQHFCTGEPYTTHCPSSSPLHSSTPMTLQRRSRSCLYVSHTYAHIRAHPSNTRRRLPRSHPCVTTQVFFRVGGRIRVRRRPKGRA